MKANKKILAIVAVVALIAILGIFLVACNADSYAKKLEKAGYKVEKTEASKDDEGHAVEWAVGGTKAGDSLTTPIIYVNVMKYKNTDDAKEAEKTLKDIVGKDCVYRTGKIVISSNSAQGVKDAK